MSKNIEDLFKEKFEQFEAPVSDGLWDKIQENPSWKKYLRRQKMTNLTVFSILAVCVIGSCILLINRNTNQDAELVDTTVVEEETIANVPQAPTIEVPSIAENQTTETVIETSAESLEEAAQTIDATTTETVTAPTINTISNNTESIDLQDNTTISKPNPPAIQSNKIITPTPTPAVQETKAVKSSEDAHNEPITSPSNSESDHSSVSLFSIPNAFTPNGDGLNDIFKPVTAANLLQYQLDIFMLNGQHIFSSKNIEYGWNGEFQGSIMNGGSYIYVIKYKDTEGKEHIDKGQLLLIR